MCVPDSRTGFLDALGFQICECPVRAQLGRQLGTGCAPEFKSHMSVKSEWVPTGPDRRLTLPVNTLRSRPRSMPLQSDKADVPTKRPCKTRESGCRLWNFNPTVCRF